MFNPPLRKILSTFLMGVVGFSTTVHALDWPLTQPTGEVPNGKIGDWGYDLRTFMAPDDVDAPISAVGVGNVADIGDGRYQATISDGTGGGGQALIFDVEGPFGAEFYCDENGLNCSTAAAIATAIAGGSTATAIQALSDAPGSPSVGNIYYDTDDDEPYVWTGATWDPIFDDLGDHTATQTLDINTQNIDGAAFDVIGASGNTTIGGTLSVAGTATLGEDGVDGSLVIYSDDAGGDYTYTIRPGVATQNVVLTLPPDDGLADQILKTDGDGNLTWATQLSGADDLGDHTATQDLDLADNDLIGTTAGITFNNFSVVGASGNTTIGGTLDVTGATGIDGDFDIGTNKFTVDATSGNTFVAGTLDAVGAIQSGADGTDGSLVIYSDDVGGDYTYTIQPGVATDNVVLTLPPDDGTLDQVLRTDGAGNLTWVDQTSGADDLGDHTATQDLDLVDNDLIGTTASIDFDNFDVDASGNVSALGSIQSGAEGTDGSLVIYSEQGGTDYTYTIQPNAAATDNVVLILPPDDGTLDQVLRTDGAGNLTWVDQTSGADDLGDHTATQDLDLADNDLIGTTAGITFNNFSVVGASGNTTIGGTLDVTGATGIDGDFDIATNKFTVNSTSGNTSVGGTFSVTGLSTLTGGVVSGAGIQTGVDGTDGSIVIYSDDIGGDFTYTIQPGVATQNVVLTLPVDDGTPNQVLQTDGSGVLTWVDQAGGADDLGDHTATENIQLNDQYISNDGGDEGIRIDDAGNVGIMTIPGGTYELEVNGDIFTYNIYGTSDERLKRNIKPLTNALDKVAQMQAVSFRWKDPSKGDQTQLGVIAQDVEKIYPQLVQTGENGYKAVNYDAIVAPLIEAVKELKERNEALDKRVRELESRLGQ